jgi:hypothetical protein
MEVQTRSEENGLKFFKTIKEAVKEAEKDITVWKISFSIGKERVRLVRIRPLKGKKDLNLWTITFMDDLINEAMKELKKAKK